jgi:hypothetical protein
MTLNRLRESAGGLVPKPPDRFFERRSADGQDVWFWRPDAGAKSAEAISPTTVARKPGHREEHGVTVKTIRVRECRVIPVDSW